MSKGFYIDQAGISADAPIELDRSHIFTDLGWDFRSTQPGCPEKTDRVGPIAQALDQTGEAAVRGGVLNLSYQDPNFDRLLDQARGYRVLAIRDLPDNVEPMHWADSGGYFLWFKGGPDHRAHHYYPDSLQRIELTDKVGSRTRTTVEDVNAERLSVSEHLMARANGLDGGFFSFNPRQSSFTGPLAYLRRMSLASDQALALEERLLSQSADSSNNPYFRIYLSDVLVAEAVKPIIDSMTQGDNPDIDNPETLRKIDEALKQVRLAEGQSVNEFRHHGLTPPNYYMPLSPYSYDGYLFPFDFWGGSLYQAQQRDVSLSLIRGLIKSGVFDRLELPPALPHDSR